MASDENRNGTAPPISRPMKTFGSATLMKISSNTPRLVCCSSATRSADRISPAAVSMKLANRATAAMTAEPIAKPLVTALVVLPDGVEADHDALGLAVELAAHLGDAGGVVADRAERVLARR